MYTYIAALFVKIGAQIANISAIKLTTLVTEQRTIGNN